MRAGRAIDTLGRGGRRRTIDAPQLAAAKTLAAVASLRVFSASTRADDATDTRARMSQVQHYILYSNAPPIAARRAVAAVPAAAAGASAGAALAQPLLAGAAAREDGGGQRRDAQGQV
jgi:hypothetical protein